MPHSVASPPVSLATFSQFPFCFSYLPNLSTLKFLMVKSLSCFSSLPPLTSLIILSSYILSNINHTLTTPKFISLLWTSLLNTNLLYPSIISATWKSSRHVQNQMPDLPPSLPFLPGSSHDFLHQWIEFHLTSCSVKNPRSYPWPLSFSCTLYVIPQQISIVLS